MDIKKELVCTSVCLCVCVCVCGGGGGGGGAGVAKWCRSLSS